MRAECGAGEPSSLNDIDRWFERTARRESRSVSLYSVLLTRNVYKYFQYRLRYVLLLDTTRFFVHVAEFLVILAILGAPATFTVMILRIGSLIVSGAWWGFLEIMRERLRDFAVKGDRDSIESEIGAWLALSVAVAAAATLVGVLALAYFLPFSGDSIGSVYAYLVLVGLALRFPVRVLHSGVFATRRIYRPSWSMFAPIAVQLLVIGAGAFLFPAGAIVGAIVVSNAVSIWITTHYTIAAYRVTGLWPKYRLLGRSLRQLIVSIPVRRGIETTLAGLGLRLDAMIVLAILGIYGTDSRAFDLTAGLSTWREVDAFQFFYLTLPLLSSAYGATGVFYFDFVRLRRIPALRQFRIWFFHRLIWLAPVLACFFWGLAVTLAFLALPDIPFSFLLALLPLFITRSVIGVYQLRMFAEGRFRALIATIGLLGLFLGLAWIDVNPASDLVQVTAAMIAILVVCINLQHAEDRKRMLPTHLSLRDWLSALSGERTSVRVGRVVIPGWIDSRQKSNVVSVIRETFDGAGHVAFASPSVVVFYSRMPSADPQSQPHLSLQAMTGGAANRAAIAPTPSANGAEALDWMRLQNWIPPLDATSTPNALETLKSAFAATFPSGVMLDLQTGEGSLEVRALDRSLLARLLPAATRCLGQGMLLCEVAGHQVTPVFHDGDVRLIFVLPREAEPEARQRWWRTVNDWNACRTDADHVSIA